MSNKYTRGFSPVIVSVIVVVVAIAGLLTFAATNAKSSTKSVNQNTESGVQNQNNQNQIQNGDWDDDGNEMEDSGNYTNQNVPPSPTSPTRTAAPVADTPKPSGKYKYKNGSYSATGTYRSPAGLDNLGVLLTLQNDIVISSSITPDETHKTSLKYQQKFISGYSSYVIGKDIDTIHLDVVSGSSLTPIGFHDALEQIKAKARI